jgi:UDP-glucose 4-epimerase
MKVLVTGGAGFLGSYITAALRSAGHQAIAFGTSVPGAEAKIISPGIEGYFHQGSIADREALREFCREQKIDAIVHSASRTGLQASLANPLSFYETNVIGMVNICEIARELDIRKLVLVSSNAVYQASGGSVLTESSPSTSPFRGNPAGHYGTSKMAAEAIGMTYAEFHNVDFVAVRVTAIYGFGMRSPLFIKPMIENAVNNLPTRLATGGPMRRDYTDARDCAAGILAALTLGPRPVGAQRIYNVSSGTLLSGTEIAAAVRRVLPAADIQIGEELSPLEAANAPMRAAFDISAAKRDLGWAPSISLDRGIADYAETYRRSLQ